MSGKITSEEECKSCGKKFTSGDSIYEGGICKECGGKGMPIAGIISREDYVKMLEKEIERGLKNHNEMGTPCATSILRKMLYLKKIKNEGKK